MPKADRAGRQSGKAEPPLPSGGFFKCACRSISGPLRMALGALGRIQHCRGQSEPQPPTPWRARDAQRLPLDRVCLLAGDPEQQSQPETEGPLAWRLGGGGAPKRGTHARPTPPSRIYTFLHVYWGDCGRSIYPLLGREGSPVQQLEPSIQNRVQVHCSYGRCPPARGPNRAAKHGDERPGRRTRVGCQ